MINKAYEGITISKLARRYNVSRKTMSKWLNALPDSIGHPVKGYLFSPDQVQAIYNKFEQPGEFKR